MYGVLALAIVAISIVCGTLTALRLEFSPASLSSGAKPVAQERLKLFLIGFFGWPLALALFLVLWFLFGDLLFLDEEDYKKYFDDRE